MSAKPAGISKVTQPVKKKDNSKKIKDIIDKGKEEIDDLFKSAKEKKLSKEKEASAAEDTTAKPKKKRKVETPVEDPGVESTYGLISSNKCATIISPEAPVHRIDGESGLPVYKAHLLKVGEGGGTPLCPFDCDCCF